MTQITDYVVVFSTYVEVILERRIFMTQEISILHVCGGDPVIGGISKTIGGYSPRMWR